MARWARLFSAPILSLAGLCGCIGCGGGTGAAQTCTDLQGAPASPVVIHVVNQTGAAVIIEDYCDLNGATGIRVDGQGLDDWEQHTCNDAVAGKCRALDCFGHSGVELPPGETYDATWKGLFRGDPRSMPSDCGCGSQLDTCSQAVAPATGDYELTVDYQIHGGGGAGGTGGTGGGSGTVTTFTMMFAFPASEVTATLMP